MSKTIIFEEIRDKIAADAPNVKEFGLWNNQFDNVDEENAFHFPAVYLEFVDLIFTNKQAGVQQIDGLITLHIGQEEIRDKNIEVLDLVDTIAKALNGMITDTIVNPLKRTGETQDADHDQIIVWEQSYTIRAVDCTSSKYNTAVTIPGGTVELDMPIVEEGDGISLVIKNDELRTSDTFD